MVKNAFCVCCNHYDEAFAEGFDEASKLWKAHCEKLVGAVELIKRRLYGRDNNWAGMWAECPIVTCSKKRSPYAFGGNWLGDELGCPECKLSAALKAHKEFMGDE